MQCRIQIICALWGIGIHMWIEPRKCHAVVLWGIANVDFLENDIGVKGRHMSCWNYEDGSDVFHNPKSNNEHAVIRCSKELRSKSVSDSGDVGSLWLGCGQTAPRGCFGDRYSTQKHWLVWGRGAFIYTRPLKYRQLQMTVKECLCKYIYQYYN